MKEDLDNVCEETSNAIEVTETKEYTNQKLNMLISDYKENNLSEKEFSSKLSKVVKSKKILNEALDVIEFNIEGKKTYIENFGNLMKLLDVKIDLKKDVYIKNQLLSLNLENKNKYKLQ